MPPGAQLPLHVRDAERDDRRRGSTAMRAAIARLARIERADVRCRRRRARRRSWSTRRPIVLPLEGVIDLAAERARLTKAIAAAEKERDALAGRLGNPSFVERAKPEAVEKARADHAEKAAEAERLARRWRGWDKHVPYLDGEPLRWRPAIRRARSRLDKSGVTRAAHPRRLSHGDADREAACRRPDRRNRRDLTDGPIGATLLAFALPTLGVEHPPVAQRLDQRDLGRAVPRRGRAGGDVATPTSSCS